MILKQPHQLFFRENKSLSIYEIAAVMTDADDNRRHGNFSRASKCRSARRNFCFYGKYYLRYHLQDSPIPENCMSDLQGNIHGISGSFKLFVGHNEYFNGHNTPRKNMLFLYCIRNRIPWQEQIGEPINIFDIN